MTETLAQKFDRWWATNGESLVGRVIFSASRHTGTADMLYEECQSAFLAGAAAERAEHEPQVTHVYGDDVSPLDWERSDIHGITLEEVNAIIKSIEDTNMQESEETKRRQAAGIRRMELHTKWNAVREALCVLNAGVRSSVDD